MFTQLPMFLHVIIHCLANGQVIVWGCFTWSGLGSAALCVIADYLNILKKQDFPLVFFWPGTACVDVPSPYGH